MQYVHNFSNNRKSVIIITSIKKYNKILVTTISEHKNMPQHTNLAQIYIYFIIHNCLTKAKSLISALDRLKSK